MALGEAFITIRADTTKFKQDLSKQLKVTLDDAQKQTDGYTKSQITAAKKANAAIVDAEKAAYRERDAMAKAAVQAKLAAEKQYEKDFKGLLEGETKAATAASREQAAAATAAAREKSAAEKAAAREMEAASRDAGRQMVAISRQTAADQIASTRAAAAAAREAATAQAGLLSGVKGFASATSGAVTGVGSAIATSIIKPLEYAALSAGALTAAIGFFGIKGTQQIQNVDVAIHGIIGSQEKYKDDLVAGQKAGDDFYNQLLQFARLTPFQFKDLGQASQQLLAIGLNGDQTIGVLKDLGNSLALTGDLSADRLNNAILAFTQINALGKVTRDNIRQITSNIPTFNQSEFVKQIATLDAIKARGAGAVATTADLAKAQKDLGNGAVPANIGLQAILNTMRETPGAAGAMDRAMGTLTGVLSNFKDTVNQAFTTAFLPVLPEIQDGLNELAPAFGTFFSSTAPAVANLIAAFSPLLITVLPSIADLLNAVIPLFDQLVKFLGPLLKGVISALVPIFQALERPLMEIGEAFLEALLPVLPQVTDALLKLVPPLTELALSLIPLAPLLVQIVSQGIVVLAQLLPPLIPFIQLFASALTGILALPGGPEILGAIALAIGAIAVAVNILVGPISVLLKLLPLLEGDLAATWLAALGPIGLVIGALALIGIAFTIAWNKSKTFQKVVVTALNILKDVIVDWVQLNVNLLLKFFDIIISGAAHAFGWVPGLGGKLKAANKAFDSFSSGVNDALNSIKNKDIKIGGDSSGLIAAVRDATKAYNAAGFQGPALPPSFPSGVHTTTSTTGGGSVGGNDDITGIGGDTTPDTSKTDAAKTKAANAAAKKKAAADKIKAAIGDLKGDFKAIGDETSKLTAAQIKTNFNALIKDLKDSGHKALAAQAKVIEDQLIADAKKLKKKQDDLTAELSIAQPIKDSITSLGNVSTPTQGVATTFNGITNNLTLAIRNAKDFVAAIKTLQAEHLDPVLLQQLVSAGPVAGLDAARALISAGLSGINTVNAQQAQLTGLGNDLANSVAPEFYEAGKHVGDGLLEGLKASEQALADEMDHIADMMISKFNKKIGAKSPSTVFAKSGDYIAQGLAMGMDRNGGMLAGAASRMSNTVITFGPGSIAVNGGVNRPQETGSLLGQGIVGVLQQRQTQAALNGTG